MLRKLLVLPVFIFGFLAITSFAAGNVFFFFAWLFLGILYLTSTYPLITEMNEKTAPVFHIFISLFAFVFFASSIAILDFHKAGFPIVQSLLYGLAIGVLLMAAFITLQNK